MAKKPQKRLFNFMLDPQTDKELAELEKFYPMPRASILRLAIRELLKEKKKEAGK